jgi:hypothetical protein
MVVPFTASAEEQTVLADVPSGYGLFEFDKLYSENKMDASTNDSKAAITCDESGGGLILSGKPSEIEKLSFTFKDEVDLGKYTACRLVVNALNEVKFGAAVQVTVDDTDTFSVASVRQKKSGVWQGEKNNCVDISSNKYSGAHTVKVSVKFKDGVADKKTKLMLKNLMFVAYSVPVVDVNVDESLGTIAAMNGDKEHQTECYGDMTINIPEGYKAEYTDDELTTETYELEYIRGRGNSTWDADKKPYKVKLSKKANLFGMGANKHWGLIANYYDYTLLRNKYTYWLGAKLGMEYTPKSVFVDVVMNGSYLGSYCLSELIRLDENRVDLDELDETVTSGDDITGGYLINCGNDSAKSNFEVNYNNGDSVSYSVEAPDFDEVMVPEQLEYIKNYFQNLYDAVYSDDLCDKNGVRYSEYLDVDSMIDYYIIQGTSSNGDAFGNGSTYLYKKRGGKLYWGPLWDFDYVAWGATEFIDINYVNEMNYNMFPMFSQLYSKDSEFKAKFDKRIKEIGDVILETTQDGNRIDKYAKDVYLSQLADHQIIPTYVEESNNELKEAGSDTINVTYDSEISRFKSWLKKKVEYQSENIDDILGKKTTANFYIDDELFHTVELDGLELDVDSIPKPTAEGKEFLYWYTFTDTGLVTIDEFVPNDYYSELNFYAEWKNKSKDDTPSLDKQSISLKSGASYSLKVNNGKAGGWLSSNPSVAAVKNGKVTALKKGSAKIYAMVGDNYHIVCKVSVTTSPSIKVRGKKLNAAKTYSVNKGKKLTLTVKGKAASVNNRYATTNKKVAKIVSKTTAKKLTVKALKKGKATVTVIVNGKAFKIKVKVK